MRSGTRSVSSPRSLDHWTRIPKRKAVSSFGLAEFSVPGVMGVRAALLCAAGHWAHKAARRSDYTVPWSGSVGRHVALSAFREFLVRGRAGKPRMIDDATVEAIVPKAFGAGRSASLGSPESRADWWLGCLRRRSWRSSCNGRWNAIVELLSRRVLSVDRFLAWCSSPPSMRIRPLSSSRRPEGPRS